MWLQKYNDTKFAKTGIEPISIAQVRDDYFGTFQIRFTGRFQKKLCMY